MDNGVDIEAIGNDGERIAVVEIRRGREITPAMAARLRRNLMAHSIIPPARYFLLVTGEQVYLWKQDTSRLIADALPDAAGATQALIAPFLKPAGLEAGRISEGALELATTAWLDELARDGIGFEALPDWLVSTGFAEAVTGADIRLQVAA